MVTSSNTTQVNPSSSIPIEPLVQITLAVSAKLDRHNFLTWKSQIEPIIDGFGLAKYLDPSFSSPNKQIEVADASQPNPAYLAWHKQDRFLLGWLRTSITEGVLSQYVACQTASQLWTLLHRVYSAISKARIKELRRSLQTTTRGGQKCSDYFEKMKSIADQLVAARELVSDSELVRSILNGLGSDFNSFVVALTTRSEPVTLVDLHAFLLSHEALLHLQNPPPLSYSTDSIALHTHTERGRARGRRGRGPPNFTPNAFQGPILPTPMGRGLSNSGLGRGQGRGAYSSS